MRTLNLAELTAQSVMTARVRVSALEDTTTAADVLNLTRATGLSRFPVYRERLDEVVGMVHLKDALAVPAARTRPAPRSAGDRGGAAAGPRDPAGAVAAGAAAQRAADRGGGRRVRRHGRSGHAGGHRGGDSSARCSDEHDGADADLPELLPRRPPKDGHPAWDADGRAAGSTILHPDRPGRAAGSVRDGGRLVADQLGRIPVPGDVAELPGWRLRVLDVGHHRAKHAPARCAGGPDETHPDGRDPQC